MLDNHMVIDIIILSLTLAARWAYVPLSSLCTGGTGSETEGVG